MRAGAIQHGRSENFNDTIKKLRTLFQSSQQHKNYWQLLMAQRITLISDEEAPGCGISAAEATDFLEHAASQAQACSLFSVAVPGHEILTDSPNLIVESASSTIKLGALSDFRIMCAGG